MSSLFLYYSSNFLYDPVLIKKTSKKMDEIIVDYNRWIVALRKKQIRVIEFVLVALNMEDDL